MSAPSSPTAAPPSKVKKPNPREAALLAAEARLGRPASSPSPGPSTAAPPKAAGSATPPLFKSTGSSSSIGTGTSKWTPTEKEERDCKIKFARLLDRGLVRDNGYRQVADGVETLILIANNVMEHDDPKYRKLKASNSLLKNKVLSLKGGHEYLIALGFRTQTIEFTQYYVYHSSLKSSFELRTGTQVLSDHAISFKDRFNTPQFSPINTKPPLIPQLAGLQQRATNAAASAQAHKEAEAARVAQALAQIEADRDGVQLRLQRNNIMREREERLKREAKEKLEKDEEEMERRREEAERTGAGPTGTTAGGMLLSTGQPVAQGDQSMDDDDDDDEGDGGGDDDEEDEEEEGDMAPQPQWGQGRTLGE